MKRWICWLCAVMCLLGMLSGAQAQAIWTKDELDGCLAALQQGEHQIPENKRILLSMDQLDKATDLDARWTHILLASSNAADMQKNDGASSLLFLLSVHSGSREMHLTVLPPSALLDVEGLPGPVPLKYINCFGGPRLVMQSLNRALGLNISRYCAVNEAVFSQAIEALGGVKISLTAEESAALSLPEGEVMLTGEDALRFVRLRTEGEGVSRPLRLMQSAYQQFTRDFSLSAIIRLARIVLPMIDTNLSIKDVISLAYTAFTGEGPLGLSFYTLTADGAGRLGDEAAAAFHQNIYGVMMP